MPDGYGVHTDAMRAHAGRLDGIRTQVGTALDAAGQASLNGTDAYGILCSPVLTPLMGAIEVLGMGAIGATHVTVGATAEGVRGMAAAYDKAEEVATDMFNGIAEGLGR
ncbi:type VII secretion target [Actinokineospora sp. G85]|uniref:type VII secretion target n=1 Tax=Actinokineospora sp. G85 TaxID=3406626 RepID=UPI003C791543